MAKTKDELKLMEGIAGTVSAIVTALVVAVRKLGGGFSHFHRLTTPEGAETMDKIAALIVGQSAEATKPLVTPGLWSKFLAALIQACQFVSYVNPNITGENFSYRDGDLSLKSVEVISIKEHLRKLNRSWLRTDEVVVYLKSLGYRPATIVELLFWWLQHPENWTNCLVVALGSVWDGRVPFVGGRGSCRGLYLSYAALDWYEGFGFAAVRE